VPVGTDACRNFSGGADITESEAVIRILALRTTVKPAPSTDDELMAAVRGGDRDAFAQIFARYREPVWRFFRRRVAEASRAEELAQDVFAGLLAAAPRYDARSSFRSYLFGIAFNVLLADRRRQRPAGGSPDLDELPVRGADMDTVMWVQRALAGLDAEDREILMLREYEQLSYQEISDVRGVPVNTVRSQLFRARAALRAELLRGEAKEARS
jgi:RNA polymerase sigma-70 factor (ECF subfamily)